MRNRFEIGDLVEETCCIGIILGIKYGPSFYGDSRKFYKIDWFYVPWRKEQGMERERVWTEAYLLTSCRKFNEKLWREKLKHLKIKKSVH
ncbi:MAG: hypothetical protein Q8P81_02070 [Nanoarchaeota archaeon]|nr:hypothetical protein [Nanoarchaeota archaeon]